MTLAQSPWRWFADELRRRDDEKSVAQLERTAVLAIKELLDRGEFDVVKRICWNQVFVEEHEQGYRLVDARNNWKR
jgi:hypothetical protein